MNQKCLNKSLSFDLTTFLIGASPVVRLLEKSTAVINRIRQERMCAGANLTDKSFLHNPDRYWSLNLFDPTDSLLFSKKSLTINFSFLATNLSVLWSFRELWDYLSWALPCWPQHGAHKCSYMRNTLCSSCRNPSDEVMTQTLQKDVWHA